MQLQTSLWSRDRLQADGGVLQVEVAFREQTAGHNALLLFVHLVLDMMESQLLNAFKELDVQQAEVMCPLP